MIRNPIRLLPVLVLLGPGASALAQAPAQVSVELTHVYEEVAARIGVDAARMPMSVLVPADVAAAACAGPPQAPQGTSGSGSCTASRAVPQLDAILRDRIHHDAAMGGPPATSRPEDRKR
jgi:hypothetical protein